MGELIVELVLVVGRLLDPTDVVARATFRNVSSEEVLVNSWRIRNPSLVLEVRDANGKRLLLPPPSPPDPEYSRPDERIPPGGTLVVDYAGVFDRGLAAGTYEVRYRSLDPLSGGEPDAPLESNWSSFQFAPGRPPARPLPIRRPPPRPPRAAWANRAICGFRNLFGLECDGLLQVEVAEPRSETITNAPPPYQDWNDTYEWSANLLVVNAEERCSAEAVVRLRVNGEISDPERSAWEQAIETKWSGKFKLCEMGCCCTNGFIIVTDVQWVAQGEHYVVYALDRTRGMRHWGRTEPDRVTHEFGHMLGNLDEYFTVNGVDWGPYAQPTGTCMNNCVKQPAARHFELVRDTVAALRGSSNWLVPPPDVCGPPRVNE